MQKTITLTISKRKFYFQFLTKVSSFIVLLIILSSCNKNVPAIQSPKINSISPDKGSIGTVVTISGENISTIASENIVQFDGVKANVTSSTSNNIIAIAPTHALGKVQVTVSVNGKTSNAVSFEYIATGNSDYFPTAGKQYNYHVTSATDNFDFYTELLNQKDSAGYKAVTIASYLPSTTVFAYAYKSNTETVYQIDSSPQATATLKLLSQQPGYVSGTLDGFPINQHMSNTPQVGEPVNFIGGPIHMNVIQNSDIPNIPLIITDFKQYYNTGKILGFETVTTTAGTFQNCLKWEYTTKNVFENTLTGKTEQNFHKVIWFAEGIGPVKDYEEGPDGKTQSELVSIH